MNPFVDKLTDRKDRIIQEFKEKRGKNIVSKDNSALSLFDQLYPEQMSNDYINSNFIQKMGTQGRGKNYIATQGPLDKDHASRTKNKKHQTIYDYWKMVVSTGSQFLIMVANLVESKGGRPMPKVGRYYPENIGESLDIYDIKTGKHDTVINQEKVKLLTVTLINEEELTRPLTDQENREKSGPEKYASYGQLRTLKVTAHIDNHLCREYLHRNCPLEYIANLDVKKDTCSWYVYQYQFTKWPDFGVPKKPNDITDMVIKINTHYEELTRKHVGVKEFVNDMKYGLKNPFTDSNGNRSIQNFRINQMLGGSKGLSGPLIVNCSAGIGRTGTIIAVDQIIDHIKWFGIDTPINVAEVFKKLRFHRPGMIQTDKQYDFIYDCIGYYIDRICSDVTNMYIDLKNEILDLNEPDHLSNYKFNGEGSEESDGGVGFYDVANPVDNHDSITPAKVAEDETLSKPSNSQERKDTNFD